VHQIQSRESNRSSLSTRLEILGSYLNICKLFEQEKSFSDRLKSSFINERCNEPKKFIMEKSS